MADSTPLPGQFLAAARSLLDRLETQGDAIDAAARIIEHVEGLADGATRVGPGSSQAAVALANEPQGTDGGPPAQPGCASTRADQPGSRRPRRSQRLFDEAYAEHARRRVRVLRTAVAGS